MELTKKTIFKGENVFGSMLCYVIIALKATHTQLKTDNKFKKATFFFNLLHANFYKKAKVNH